MKIILGLTGGSGTGKSQAAEYLKKCGAEIIDADKVAREIVTPGKPALNEIAQSFEGVLCPDGSLNRKKLGTLVFADKNALERLNKITHTYILNEIKSRLAGSKSSLLVIDAPLLLEYDLDKLCTVCICILADPELRKTRIMRRDNLTEEDAKNRIASQKSDDFYKIRCKIVIENNDNIDTLHASLDAVLKEL